MSHKQMLRVAAAMRSLLDDPEYDAEYWRYWFGQEVGMAEQLIAMLMGLA